MLAGRVVGMPLAGGAADKAGNRYERLWTVYVLLDLLDGDAASIRIEVPGDEGSGAEFQVIQVDRTSWHQAKRQRDAGPWTIAALSNEGVLASWWSKIAAGGRIVFVSSTGAQELRELVERANDAASWNEFSAQFLTGEQASRFRRLRTAWGDPPEHAVYKALRQVEVVLIDEAKLRELVQVRLKTLVTGLAPTAAAVLADLVDGSVHQELTAAQVWDCFKQHEILPRNLPADVSVIRTLSTTVDRYLARLRRNYIGGRKLARPEAESAFAELVEGRRVLIAGAAGMGKSVVAGQVTELARGAGWKVLVMSADRLPQADTVEALGVALGLPDSPPIALAGAAGGGDCLLIVDQLDAVSVTSGRRPDGMELIEDLITDAAALPRLRVLLVCRQFDLDNDRQLRAVATHGDSSVIGVGPFERGVILQMLADAGLATSLPVQLVELLAVPQHLAIYLGQAAAASTDPLTIRTLTDLYDRYWRTKRQACRTSRGDGDGWEEVIDALVDYMSAHQSLHVPAAALDSVDRQIGVMASENVLNVEDQAVSFVHETFFDYCYARRFVGRGHNLAQLLTAGEQDLFRRAQVRQILTYERATVFDKYRSDLAWLLGSHQVRMHVKALIVALMQTVADPRPAEWEVLAPIAAADGPLRDRLWQALRRNPAWFTVLQKAGAWAQWLGHRDRFVVDRALWLLSGMTHEHGDAAATVLRSLSRDEHWPSRVRGFLLSADVSAGRQLFDILVQAVRDRHFDGEDTSDIWHVARRLVEGRPEWAAEIIATLFAQALAGGVTNPFEGRGPLAIRYDRMEGEIVRATARSAPLGLVQLLLPHVLEIARRNSRPDWSCGDLLPDALWGHRPFESRTSLADDLFDGLADALRHLAQDAPDVAAEAFARLRADPHQVAWLLLARGYAANPERFADSAVQWLASTPGALHLGYPDAEHWVSRDLVSAISPVCGEEKLGRLVEAVIGYTTPYERTYEGLRVRGFGEFCLLNAIDPARRSERAERRLAELRRKFLMEDVPPPRGFRGGVIPPPIPEARARKMSDNQWLRAMARHDQSGPQFDSHGNFTGDAGTQAQVLEDLTRESPERYARLLLRMTHETTRPYVGAVLQGLRGAHLDPTLLLSVCQHVERIGNGTTARYLAELVQADAAMAIPDEILDMIARFAVEHPEPVPPDGVRPAYATNDWEATRGAAALAIGELIRQHNDLLYRFQETIERLATDPAWSVRHQAVVALTVTLYRDAALSIDLFQRSFTDVDDEHLSDDYIERFINHAIRRGHYGDIADVVTRQVASGVENARLAGVRQLTVAAYHNTQLDPLVDEAIADDAPMRAAAVKVVADNLTVPIRRDRAFELLAQAFDDPTPEVRSAAITCFYGLEDQPLGDYAPLLNALVNSRAIGDNIGTILHVLTQARQPLPAVTLDLCSRILAHHQDSLGDLTSSSARMGHYLVPLVVRLHAQHSDPTIRRRCLDLIDQLVAAGAEGVDKGLAAVER
jgi:hypothetical protein